MERKDSMSDINRTTHNNWISELRVSYNDLSMEYGETPSPRTKDKIRRIWNTERMMPPLPERQNAINQQRRRVPSSLINQKGVWILVFLSFIPLLNIINNLIARSQ